jgi:hypothetical protein
MAHPRTGFLELPGGVAAVGGAAGAPALIRFGAGQGLYLPRDACSAFHRAVSAVRSLPWSSPVGLVGVAQLEHFGRANGAALSAK